MASLDVCFGSLSAIKQWLCGYTLSKNGSNVWFKTSMYRGVSNIPSNIQILVLPGLLIPAQTWIFTGCFALREKLIVYMYYFIICIHEYYYIANLGLDLGGLPCFLQQNRLWVSSWTEHSSVHTTSSNSSCRYARCSYVSHITCSSILIYPYMSLQSYMFPTLPHQAFWKGNYKKLIVQIKWL